MEDFEFEYASDLLSAIYQDFESYFSIDFFNKPKKKRKKKKRKKKKRKKIKRKIKMQWKEKLPVMDDRPWKLHIAMLPTSLKGKKTIFSKFIKPILKFKPRQKDGFYYRNSKQLKQKYEKMTILYEVKGAGENEYNDTFSWTIARKKKMPISYFKKYIYNKHPAKKPWYLTDIMQANVCKPKGLEFVRFKGFYAV